jgi:hypothetical protein
MTESSTSWFLLIVSLPTQGATARMRIWRALKTLGCAALRDGAYLLPGGGERDKALRALADECIREDGSAWLMSVQPRDGEETAAYLSMFDRTPEFSELRKGWKDIQGLNAMSPPEVQRLQRRLLRDYAALKAIDYFPNDSAVETEAAWIELNRRLEAQISPDEPSDTLGEIPRLQAAGYRGRTWATRRKLWVDRVASAWLIRRFIDPEAKFKWLAKPSDCPKSALGFDFDGATFTHVGARVTFETLLASFGLEEDRGLVRLGALVHQLDIGGPEVPEAVGFEAVMAGARERLDDDDMLLAEMSSVLDSLYAHFGRDPARTKP